MRATPPAAYLDLLGGFRLRTRDGAVASPRSVKARAMIAHLALAPGGVVDRGRLSGLLWSESGDAKASLRQCVKEVRRSFAAAGLTLLDADRLRVALDVRSLRIDALEVERLGRSTACRDLEEMAALYQGDLLEGLPVRDPAFEVVAGGRTGALTRPGLPCRRARAAGVHRDRRSRGHRGARAGAASPGACA